MKGIFNISTKPHLGELLCTTSFSKTLFFQKCPTPKWRTFYLITNSNTAFRFSLREPPWMLFWFKIYPDCDANRLVDSKTWGRMQLSWGILWQKSFKFPGFNKNPPYVRCFQWCTNITMWKRPKWRKIQLMGKQQRKHFSKAKKCWILCFFGSKFPSSRNSPIKKEEIYIPQNLARRSFPLWFGGIFWDFSCRVTSQKNFIQNIFLAEFSVLLPSTGNEKPHSPLLQFWFRNFNHPNSEFNGHFGIWKPFRVRSGRNSSKNIPCCPKLLQPVVRAMDTPLLWAKNCILSCEVAWLYEEDTCSRNTCQLNDLIYIYIQCKYTNIHM